MNVLGIVGSHRKDGNTEILVREALDAAREAGAETDIVLTADMNIAPCDGCCACEKTGTCRIKDDMQTIYERLKSADGVILGTPVYFANVSAQTKAVMDRMYALLRVRALRGKVAGAVVAARRMGAGQTLGLLYLFFQAQRMVVAGGAVGFGEDKGEVRKGTGASRELSALEEARAVGRAVVRLAERLRKGTTRGD